MDIDLDFYRSQHDELSGREWLFNELDENMFFSKRGVLLLAEMGYGKSAIVAHLICQSDKRFPGYEIYQHIAVYRICNFYSRKTLSPGNFVKNLAGGFSKRIPGFLQSLQKNSRFKTYFESDRCEEDPEGCLDVLVLKVLNYLDMVNNTYIVVIDALDECIELAYLTDNIRKTEQFYVSKRDGCRLFAKYLLNLLRQQRSFTNISIVDLASYAACSSDKEIKYKFLQNSKKYISEFSEVYIPEMYILHQAAGKLNSYTAMPLLLDLFSLRPVDETDKGNITASYVAAASGNHRSLKALLDCHADVNFVRLGPRFINETVDMLQFCKTFAFWEYSLLNIAAQNGHFKTVLTLIRDNANISHQTSFGSNSFLLAVENGYTHIVQEYLLRLKSVFITNLNQALYFSAKNGYVDVVDLLLYHGAEDLCLSCNSSQYWAFFHQTRLQSIDSGEDLRLYDFVFLDDRRYIKCETALEVAIRNGHTEIVWRLIEIRNYTLRCREAVVEHLYLRQ
uniref:Nephrocystin 3-like N-terminal domain-containing protein n=1 Tax=Magallana gigas TaxID=29159 RepID=A0A8W8K3G5_MAGGI